MKYSLAFFLTICSFILFAQDPTAELKTLTDNQQYSKIITEYASKSKDYPAKSLYYIGHAYYMKEDDNNCIRFMNLAIEKDATDPASFYIKASTLNYMQKFEEAIKSFHAAIDLKPTDARFYSGLGDAYYNLEKPDAALVAYKKAIEQENCPDRPYLFVGQIYSEQEKNGEALAAFYLAKSKVDKKSGSYINALYNIGLLESLGGNYDKAEPAFVELLQLDPADYQSYAKLIQVYYYKKEYDKAKPFKTKLYEAHKNGLLKNNLSDMFCFDQFKWKDYLVQTYERYQNENKGNIYNKHIFYVIDNAGKIVLSVQTEFSPVSVEMGGPRYLLCANKGSAHFNSGIGFNDNLDYGNLKAEAIKLFEKHLK